MYNSIPIKKILPILGLVILATCITRCPSPEQKMKDVTVRIDGRVAGSGVIIGKNGNNYDVLVVKHTIATQPGQVDAPYSVVTVDEKSHNIKYKQIQQDRDVDLAIVTFQSERTYAVADISSQSLDKDADVFVSGWKNCTQKPIYELTRGKVIEVKPTDISPIDSEDGYQIKYTNSTTAGMSGSPVFNLDTKLIAIHGMSGDGKANNYDLNKCPPLSKSIDSIMGNNFGIPIDIFLKSSIGRKNGN